MAELAAGPQATNDPIERGRRQDRLQRAEATFDPLPFDSDAARAYGRIFALVIVRLAARREEHEPSIYSSRLPRWQRICPLHSQRQGLRAISELVEIVSI